jgi:hypothetical protein
LPDIIGTGATMLPLSKECVFVNRTC